MTAFQQGTLHFKQKTSTQSADSGWIRLYALMDGGIYRKDSVGDEYRLIDGNVDSNQVAFGIGTGNISGCAGLTYDGYTLRVTNNWAEPPELPNLGFQVADNVDTYLQINVQNLSPGLEASTDIVVTNDAGDDNDNWFDFGINGSGFNQGYWTVNGASDAYLYANNANVAIGTATTGKEIVIFTGGTQTSNIRAKFTDNGIFFTPAQSLVGGNTGFVFTGAANTGIPAGDESHDVLFDLARTVTWLPGNVLQQSAVQIHSPVYAFTGPGTDTFTNAATFAIDGPPTAGPNAVITNGMAAWIQSGLLRVDGTVAIAAGTPSALSLYFFGDNGTGVFSPTPGVIDIVADGADTVSISALTVAVSGNITATNEIYASGNLVTTIVTLGAAPTPSTNGTKGAVGFYNGYLYKWVDTNVVVRSIVETSW